MLNEEVKALIEAGLEGARVEVEGEGSKYHVTVISEQFSGLTPVKKQQLVYSTLNELIADGRVHAVTMSLHTPEQWNSLSK